MKTTRRKPRRPVPLPDRLDAARVLDVLNAEVAAAEQSPEWMRESDPAEWPPAADAFFFGAN